MPHTMASGGGFVSCVDSETGEPRSRSTNRPYTSTWESGYGYGIHAETANLCHERFLQLKDVHPSLAEEYRVLVLATADAYLAEEPGSEALVKPGAVGSVIRLLLSAWEMTGQDHYLDRAHHFARLGMSLFLGDGLPLPKATNKHGHYETITGGPEFMHALLRLGEIENTFSGK